MERGGGSRRKAIARRPAAPFPTHRATADHGFCPQKSFSLMQHPQVFRVLPGRITPTHNLQ
jgi:hypothetical protein